MEHAPVTAEERFASIVEELLGYPGVTPPDDGTRGKKGFGSSGLKVNDKIFAMLVRGELVLKMSKARVDALVDAGKGERFDPRHNGRVLKEWITLGPTAEQDWLPLSREALEFVASRK